MVKVNSVLNNKPDVSVVMAVYNGERNLKQAIDSVLMQELSNIELIIVDDGSTDNSLSIIQAAQKQDQRVQLISREHRGLVPSLNQAIANCNAEFIARMGADDISMPERLNLQFEFLLKNPAVVCVGSYSLIIDQSGRALTEMSAPEDDHTIQRLLLNGHFPIEHPASLVRKSAIAVTGGYHADFYPSEELDFWLRLGEVGALAYIPKMLYKSRIMSEPMNSFSKGQQIESAQKACQSAWQRRRTAGNGNKDYSYQPEETLESRYTFFVKIGWWAFNFQNKDAAMVYALKAIRLSPFNKSGWRLLFLNFIKN